jgi:phosphate transport system substrate-binding protein
MLSHVLQRSRLPLALSGLAALLLAGCGGGRDETPPGGNAPTAPKGSARVQLTGTGATFPYPIYSKWFSLYNQSHADVRINYQSLGSGAGVQQLKSRTVDFGASDAPLSDAEMKEMPAPVLHIPTVAGAVVLAYNLPGVSTGLKLTPEAVAGIFLGRVTKWNDAAIAQANPGVQLPGTSFLVVHRSDGSGTTHLFTSYLAAVSPEWKTRVGAGKSVNWPVGQGGRLNEGVTTAVKQTPGSIGYVELAFAHQNRMPYASVRNQAGQFVPPSVASTTAAAAGAAAALDKDIRSLIVNAPGADAYPIAGLTYILLYRSQSDAAKGKALVDFLNWAIHDGQKEADALLYAPLPPAIVQANEMALKTVTLGK